MSQIRYADNKQNIEMVSLPRYATGEAIVVAKTEKQVIEIVHPQIADHLQRNVEICGKCRRKTHIGNHHCEHCGHYKLPF